MSRSVLASGIEVLSEHIPGVRSAAVGVWVRQGSVHEAEDDSGVSHMLEHMVFKGTDRRTSVEIAVALEGLGGSLDAYTSREQTSYQARVLDEHVPEALDVLSDLVIRPRLDESDLSLEREVVLEEIAQVEDTPDDLVFELHCERLWNGHPYGRSILGTSETVGGMSAQRLRDLHQDRYTAAKARGSWARRPPPSGLLTAAMIARVSSALRSWAVASNSTSTSAATWIVSKAPPSADCAPIDW